MSRLFMRVAATLLGGVTAVTTERAVAQESASLDAADIAQAPGFKAQVIAEEKVFKIWMPPADVKIAVDRCTMPPFMDLSRGRILGAFRNANS